MEQNFDLDKLFRETLGNATDVPPSSAWNDISNQISQAPAPSAGQSGANWFSKLGVVSKVAVVAIGLTLVGVGSVSLLNPGSEKVNVPQKNKIQVENNQSLLDTSVVEAGSLEKINPGSYLPLNMTHEELDVFPGNEDFVLNDTHVVKTNAAAFGANYGVDKGVFSPAENHLNVSENVVNPELNIACRNSTSVMQMPSAGFMEKGEKFAIKTGSEIEKILVNYGDGRIENIQIDGNEAIASHIYKVRDRKVFLVKVLGVYKGGCKDSSMIEIEALPTLSKEEELIPTVFTPNGDGKNDEYFVSVADPLSYSLLIMDMKKNKVFYSENKSENWTGNCGVNPCESGFYEVILKLQYTGEKEMVINKRINLVRKGN